MDYNSGLTLQVVSTRQQEVDVNDRGLFSLCELRLKYLDPLDVLKTVSCVR